MLSTETLEFARDRSQLMSSTRNSPRITDAIRPRRLSGGALKGSQLHSVQTVLVKEQELALLGAQTKMAKFFVREEKGKQRPKDVLQQSQRCTIVRM